MPDRTAPTQHLTRGYLIAAVSALILSTTGIFIRVLTQTYLMPPLVLAFWRDTLVALVLLPALALRRPARLAVRRRDLLYLVGYGLVLAVFNALWTLSVALNGAAVATVLVYSSAAFTAVLGRWLLAERLGWVKLVAVGVSLAGCALVSGALEASAWRANLLGISTGVLSGLLYAAYSVLGRAASQRGLDPWTTVLFTFASAAVFLAALNALPGGWVPGAAARAADFLWLGDRVSGWAILFALAAGPTVIGFGLYNVSLAYLPSSVANVILTTEPVFTAAIAYALLGERLSTAQVAGSAMILSGVVFLRLHERSAPART
ncbi:MAG TPA: DMT family transporter [Thermoanaerobaculaceae bacterium]|nr:DMT family transporter [Thermoanaerobaculaceae bacterium]